MGSPDRLGEVLAGRYRVERIIGEGGMGIVLAAEHLELGERVAVKLLLPSAAKNKDAVARFQREARAAARIPSEHVARVMDVGTLDDGIPYLVMEYLEGRDLSAEVDTRGPLPIEEAVGYLLQAAIGVSEAHSMGIVHRDLKPSNLFLARLQNGRTMVKVLDFGIAKVEKDSDANKLTKSFSALGSISYMSPEQLRTAKDVDARADVWAFGVVLFELLTAKMPFDGETLTAIASSITADRPHPLREFRPEAPAELEAVIFSCLDKDRQTRTPSLAALGSALERFGGRNASMFAARIVDVRASRMDIPAIDIAPGVFEEFPPPAAIETPATAQRETVATGPSWVTIDEAEPPTVKQWRGKRLRFALAATGGVALLALLSAIAWSRLGRQDPQTATASIPTTPAVVAEAPPPPPPALVDERAPSDSATSEEGEAPPVASARRSAPSTRNTPSATSGSGKKSTTSSRKVKKPLVTDL